MKYDDKTKKLRALKDIQHGQETKRTLNSDNPETWCSMNSWMVIG
jgi:hypothetical protein